MIIPCLICGTVVTVSKLMFDLVRDINNYEKYKKAEKEIKENEKSREEN